MTRRRTSRKIAARTSRPLKANGGKRASARGGSDWRRMEDVAREAGWDVSRTARGHLVFKSPDKSVPPLHTISAESDPRSLKNTEALLRRHGLETRQSKRVKKNVTPSVARPVGPSSQTGAWVKRTFAPGTPVKTLRDLMVIPSGHILFLVSSPRIGNEDLLAGTRGVVTEAAVGHGGRLVVRLEIADARDESGQRLDRVIGKTLELSDSDILSLEDFLEPLVDNWATPAPKPLSRTSLPFSQKRTSRKLRPNILPLPPGPGQRSWIERTYAVGTPVKLLQEYRMGYTWLPVGTLGVVVPPPRYGDSGVWVEITDAPGKFGMSSVTGHIFVVYDGQPSFPGSTSTIQLEELLAPLVDNWDGPTWAKYQYPERHRLVPWRKPKRRR